MSVPVATDFDGSSSHDGACTVAGSSQPKGDEYIGSRKSGSGGTDVAGPTAGIAIAADVDEGTEVGAGFSCGLRTSQCENQI